MAFTLKQLEELREKGLIRGWVEGTKSGEKYSAKGGKNIPEGKKHKYSAVATVVDDIRFDSRKEANRYKELVLLRKAGLIGLLELQVPYELNTGGTYSLKYIADFVYVDALTGQKVVEDAKGYRTTEYKKKKRLMWKVHKIKIMEV